MSHLFEFINHFQFFYQGERILWYLGFLIVAFLIAKSKLRALIGITGIFLSFKLISYCFAVTNNILAVFGLAVVLSFAILECSLIPLFYGD